MSVNPTEELSNSVSKLVELNKQITEAREDIKILVQAEKSLKLQVKKTMTENGLDVINLKKGKISVKKSSRKQGLNKTSVMEGLTTYFNGNEEQAESCLKVILENLPTKESTSLSLTGIKDKKQELVEFKNQKPMEAYNQVNPDGHSIEKEKWSQNFEEIKKQANEALKHLEKIEESLK